MAYVQVNIERYFKSLEGDVSIEDITTMSGAKWVHRGTTWVDGDFTIVTWAHDGRNRVDIYLTQDGRMEVHVADDPFRDEYEEDDALFMAVYLSSHASLDIEGHEIPPALRQSFIDVSTVPFKEW